MTKKNHRILRNYIWIPLLYLIGMMSLVIPGSPSAQTLFEVGPVTSHESADPFILYPVGLKFDVFRKGTRVGSHKVSFGRDGDQLIVESEFKLKVKVFFVTAYKFVFEATGIWQGGALVSIKGNVNDNGKKIKIDAYRDDDGKFFTTGKKGEFVADSWVYPTTHWNIGSVDQSAVLNMLTGNLDKVLVRRLGIETIETLTGSLEAEKFEYTGDLRDTNVWYDREGRWVKMVFTTKSGETIEYVCRECGVVNIIDQASASEL
ncbi:MAG: DUF6134 family protein [Rhodospirillaceae bacterium]